MNDNYFARFVRPGTPMLSGDDFEQLKCAQENSRRIECKTGVECELCGNKGRIITYDAEAKAKNVFPCTCEPRRRTIEHLMNLGLWEQVRRCRIDNFVIRQDHQQIMASTAQRFVADASATGLLFSGQPGCGKTHLSNWIFGQLSSGRSLRGRYMNWLSAVRDIKAAAQNGDSSVFDSWKTAPLLYLDDFLKVRSGSTPSDADVKLAFELMNFRLERKLLTVISSEWALEEIMGIDEALAGRIRQLCGAYVVHVARDAKKDFRIFGNGGGNC